MDLNTHEKNLIPLWICVEIAICNNKIKYIKMIRARFFVEKKKCDGDYRPLIWPIQYPYWCTGENDRFFYFSRLC